MADPALPGRAVHLPIGDIVLPRDEQRKIKVAGTVLYTWAGEPCVLLADCSEAALCQNGVEIPARAAGQAEPSLVVDLSLLLLHHDSTDGALSLPARGDKLLVTGTLYRSPHSPPSAAHNLESSRELMGLGGRTGWALEAQAVLVQDLDVAAFNRTARRMARHVAWHTAWQKQEQEHRHERVDG